MDLTYRDPTDLSRRPFRAQRDGRKLRSRYGEVRRFESLKAANAALRTTR